MKASKEQVAPARQIPPTRFAKHAKEVADRWRKSALKLTEALESAGYLTKVFDLINIEVFDLRHQQIVCWIYGDAPAWRVSWSGLRSDASASVKEDIARAVNTTVSARRFGTG